MTEPRFYVFKCTPTSNDSGPCYVIDRLWGHMIVSTHMGRSHREAQANADKLNREHTHA